jgi:hypothetical protein
MAERKGAAYRIKPTRPASHHGEHTQTTQATQSMFGRHAGPLDFEGNPADLTTTGTVAKRTPREWRPSRG